MPRPPYSCSCSVLNPERTALNALTSCQSETDEQRTARHLRYCQELADLGMQLARAAAQRAMREAAGSPDAETAPAPSPKSRDPGQTFIQLSRAVREAVALEARIAAGPASSARNPARRPDPGCTAPSAPPDHRREVIVRILDDATALHPDRVNVRRGIAERLEHDLASDPNHECPAGAILACIVEDLGIDIEYEKLSGYTLEELLPDPGTGPPGR